LSVYFKNQILKIENWFVNQYLRQNALTLEGWGYTNEGCLAFGNGKAERSLYGFQPTFALGVAVGVGVGVGEASRREASRREG
jgi:hypothetical protein